MKEIILLRRRRNHHKRDADLARRRNHRPTNLPAGEPTTLRPRAPTVSTNTRTTHRRSIAMLRTATTECPKTYLRLCIWKGLPRNILHEKFGMNGGLTLLGPCPEQVNVRHTKPPASSDLKQKKDRRRENPPAISPSDLPPVDRMPSGQKPASLAPNPGEPDATIFSSFLFRH